MKITPPTIKTSASPLAGTLHLPAAKSANAVVFKEASSLTRRSYTNKTANHKPAGTGKPSVPPRSPFVFPRKADGGDTK